MTLKRRQFLQLAAGAVTRSGGPTWCPGASLSGAAGGGGICARLCARQCARHRGAPDRASGWRSGSASHSSSRTGRAPAAISAPRRWCGRRRTATRCSIVTTANATNTTLYDNLNFNFIRDIAPIAAIIRVPNLVTVNPSIPVKTIPELIGYARANPGKLNFGAANGGTVQLSGELFKMMTKVDIVHVPYRRSGAGDHRPDVGQMQVSFDVMPTTLEYVKAGKLRALAVTTAERSAHCRMFPTVAGSLPGYEASS